MANDHADIRDLEQALDAVEHERRHLWQAWNVRRAEERARGQHTEAPA